MDVYIVDARERLDIYMCCIPALGNAIKDNALESSWTSLLPSSMCLGEQEPVEIQLVDPLI